MHSSTSNPSPTTTGERRPIPDTSPERSPHSICAAKPRGTRTRAAQNQRTPSLLHFFLTPSLLYCHSCCVRAPPPDQRRSLFQCCFKQILECLLLKVLKTGFSFFKTVTMLWTMCGIDSLSAISRLREERNTRQTALSLRLLGNRGCALVTKA